MIAGAAPVAWAALLGAAARVAGVKDDAISKITSDAFTAGRAHAADRRVLRDSADTERTEARRLAALLERMDAELVLAEDVHRSLLPDDLVSPDVEVVARQIPCSHVGGDYLHVARPRPDRLYLCIGDVAGHGVSAALVVSRIHGLVQASILAQRTPGEVVEDLARGTPPILAHTSLFMTFAVFRVDPAAERIEYATAGHPAQMLLRSDGRVEGLVSTGTGLLGTSHAGMPGPVRAESVAFRRGDTLILFTDGLFEVLGRERGEMLGESGLTSIVRDLADSPPAKIASEILRVVTGYGRPGSFDDDVSLMVVRLGSPVERSPGKEVPVSAATPGA